MNIRILSFLLTGQKSNIILLLIFLSYNVFAQGPIIKKNGNEIKAAKIEFGDEDVRYILIEDTNHDSSLINRYEIFMIEHKYGETGVFDHGTESGQSFDPLYSPGRMYQRGYNDGRAFYKNKGTFWGAFGVGLLTPYTYFVPGLAIGGTMAIIPPNQRIIRYHDLRITRDPVDSNWVEINALFNDVNYSKGYSKGAHNKKLGSVAGGLGAGFGTGIVIGLAVVVIILSSIG